MCSSGWELWTAHLACFVSLNWGATSLTLLRARVWGWGFCSRFFPTFLIVGRVEVTLIEQPRNLLGWVECYHLSTKVRGKLDLFWQLVLGAFGTFIRKGSRPWSIKNRHLLPCTITLSEAWQHLITTTLCSQRNEFQNQMMWMARSQGGTDLLNFPLL